MSNSMCINTRLALPLAKWGSWCVLFFQVTLCYLTIFEEHSLKLSKVVLLDTTYSIVRPHEAPPWGREGASQVDIWEKIVPSGGDSKRKISEAGTSPTCQHDWRRMRKAEKGRKWGWGNYVVTVGSEGWGKPLQGFQCPKWWWWGGRVVLFSHRQRPGMLLDILQCHERPLTTKDYLCPSDNSVEVEKSGSVGRQEQ